MKTILKIWGMFVLWLQNLLNTTKKELPKTEELPKQNNIVRKFTILNKRPENVSFIEYKNYLKKQKKWIKNRKKGFLVYLSSQLLTKEFDGKDKRQYIKKYHPFIGNVKRDLHPI